MSIKTFAQMYNFMMRNVGDGLNLLLEPYGEGLMIDYGGTKNLNLDRINGNFLLTHFHLDHYKGLLALANSKGNPGRGTKIDTFYFPVMPKFKGSKEFYRCLFVTNARLLKRPLQSSIYALLSKINNNNPIDFVRLKKGDFLPFRNQIIEIVWPPETIDSEDTVSTVEKAINEFHQAMEKDEDLKRLYDSIEIAPSEEENRFPVSYRGDLFERVENRPVPDFVRAANKSLRAAANRLCIAFRCGDYMLFLGDLESREIRQVSQELLHRGQSQYKYLVPAHHGTHWHDCLHNLEVEYCLVSVGDRLRKKLKFEHYQICQRFLPTSDVGSISYYWNQIFLVM